MKKSSERRRIEAENLFASFRSGLWAL